MTRAEATARAVAAEDDGCVVIEWHGGTHGWRVEVPRETYDARALAWAAGEHLYQERQWVVMYHGVYAWNLASMIRAGTWPTRDAEHAAWAGRYRPQAGPAPAQSAAPVPELAGGSPELATGAAQGTGVLDLLAKNVAAARADHVALLERFDALHDHSFANARRLDALTAQVGRVESVVRQLTCWPGNTTNRQDVYERIVKQLNGGPDA